MEHPQLLSFYRQLLNDPFAIDPDDYPKILTKAQEPSERDKERRRKSKVLACLAELAQWTRQKHVNYKKNVKVILVN